MRSKPRRVKLITNNDVVPFMTRQCRHVHPLSRRLASVDNGPSFFIPINGREKRLSFCFMEFYDRSVALVHQPPRAIVGFNEIAMVSGTDRLSDQMTARKNVAVWATDEWLGERGASIHGHYVASTSSPLSRQQAIHPANFIDMWCFAADIFTLSTNFTNFTDPLSGLQVYLPLQNTKVAAMRGDISYAFVEEQIRFVMRPSIHNGSDQSPPAS